MRSVHVGRMGRQRSANNATCNQAPSVSLSDLLGGSRTYIALFCRRFCHNDSPQVKESSGGGWMEASHDDRRPHATLGKSATTM
jgi:hypothetical protein